MKLVKKKQLPVLLILFLFTPAYMYALSAEQIIQKLEDNLVYKTSMSTGKIVITDRFGQRISTYKSFTMGSDKSMVEFTGKGEEGQKILRLGNEIYLYYPDAEEIIRLQGSALKQSVMGSDMSYEDMAGDKSILDSYNVVLAGETTVNGRNCYKMELDAKKQDVPYQKQTMWVDKEYFTYQKIVQKAKSGRILKELTVQKILHIKNHFIPVDILIEDQLKKNSSTRFIIDSFEINPDIPKDTFNLQGLW